MCVQRQNKNAYEEVKNTFLLIIVQKHSRNSLKN